MRRIPIPICTCCNNVRAEWESTRYQSLRLCYVCLRDTAQFIVEEIGVKDGNPILLELVRGVDASRGESHRFWIKNPDNSYSECWVNEKANPE